MTRQTTSFTPDAATEAFHLTELPACTRLSLRVRPENAPALAQACSVNLPERIGARSGREGIETLCLGPDEWVLIAPPGARGALCARFTKAYAEIPHACCDISDREITLALSGPGVLDMLATGIARDLDAVAEGSGWRTLFDSVSVVLWRDGPEEFRIDVWRSFAPHLRALLALAEAERAAGL